MTNIIEFADHLCSQIDIAQVVEGYTQLRRFGRNMKGLCPFHREKTPSFTVSEDKQIFHCFGCGEGGNVIRFVQKIERVEWIEAVRMLSDRYKIPMPEYRRGEAVPGQDELKAKLHEVNRTAAEFFTRTLETAMASPDAEIAGYARRRGIDADTVRRFSLGLAPDSWNAFLDAGRRAGFERDTLVTAGFVIHNRDADRFYDRFRKRLVFTICDGLGRPIAFGARVYAADAAADEPKYVNSPETPLYRKGQHLYALHLARETIQREGCALVMEGYMDVIRAHQSGFTNAVATCGTALTDEQARSLKRLCREVLFVYDGDEAGQKAMLRGCEILLEHDFRVRVVGLPDEHDPDSFLVAEGAEAFAGRMRDARDAVDFFLQSAAARHNLRTVEGKVQVIEFVLPLLRKVANAVARAEYVRRAAQYAGVEESSVMRRMRDQDERAPSRLREQVAATAPAPGGIACERHLLRVAVEMPAMRDLLATRLDPDWLADDLVRQWFTRWRGITTGENVTWDTLLAACDDDGDTRFLRALALEETCPLTDTEEDIACILSRIEFDHRRRRNMELARLLSEYTETSAPPSGDDPCAALTRELDQARDTMRDLGQQYLSPAPHSPDQREHGH